MTHVFDHYGPVAKSELGARNNGVLVSMVSGKTLAYALFSLQERGRLFIEPISMSMRAKLWVCIAVAMTWW